MIRAGLRAALEHAEGLPVFPSVEEAEQTWYRFRDELCAALVEMARASAVVLDFSPESLKGLEKWYFDLVHANGFEPLGVAQSDFEWCMGIYEGFVYVKNDPEFKWIVRESSFKAGAYQIGVKKGLFSLMLGPASHLRILKNNKRMESMFRSYRERTAPSEPSIRKWGKNQEHG